MCSKSEFARLVLEGQKWNEDWDVYKQELLNFMLSKSTKYDKLSDLPSLSEADDRDVRS